jgi:hypothetical protein
MGFLPQNYEPPQSGNYMKLVLGDNRFRVLGPAIVGNMFWTTDNSGGRKPVRRRPHEKIEPHELGVDKEGKPERAKHFWAMPVWNCSSKQVQILELTQATVREAIAALYNSEDWGDPTGYDIIIKKAGSGLDTEYSVIPGKQSPVAKDIAAEFARLAPDMEALYEGGDPLAGKSTPARPAPAPQRSPVTPALGVAAPVMAGGMTWEDSVTAVLEAGLADADWRAHVKALGLTKWNALAGTKLVQDYIVSKIPKSGSGSGGPLGEEEIPFSWHPLPG